MRKKINLISVICTIVLSVFSICTYIPTTNVSNAKVIEPEIVKTENWVTSYYIDNDKNTTYPYIECQADIYSDGTVKCYFWNTHEWDGFTTVSHVITIINSSPYSNKSMEYMFKNKLSYSNGYYYYYPVSYKNSKTFNCSTWDNIDLSYYPDDFKYYSNYHSFNTDWYSSNKHNPTIYYYYESESSSYGRTLDGRLEQYRYYGALPNLLVNEKTEVVFTPKVDITKEYSFRFLGHDFKVSPEILSSNVIATPQLTAQDAYIKELENKNNELTQQITALQNSDVAVLTTTIENLQEEIDNLNTARQSLMDDDKELWERYKALEEDYNVALYKIKELSQVGTTTNISDTDNSISRLDTNNDGKINSIDATNILEIYAINSTGGNIKTFEDLENYKNNQKEKDNKPTIINSLFPEEDGGDLNNGAYNNIKYN